MLLLLIVAVICTALPRYDSPAISSIQPNRGLQGSSIQVTITGTGFSSDTTIVPGDPGVIVTSTELLSSTEIRGWFVLSGKVAVFSLSLRSADEFSAPVTFEIEPNKLNSPNVMSSNFVVEFPPEAQLVDGVGSRARFLTPRGLWSDGISLYVAEYVNNAIRKIDLATG